MLTDTVMLSPKCSFIAIPGLSLDPVCVFLRGCTHALQ